MSPRQGTQQTCRHGCQIHVPHPQPQRRARKGSGRLCLGAHTNGEVGGMVRDLPIALSRGFSRFCFGTTKPFLGMIFFF